MKIGIDIRMMYSDTRAMRRYLQNLVKNIALLDNKNEYFLFTDDKNSVEKSNFGKNFKIIFLKRYFHNDFWANFTLRNKVKKINLDLFHFPTGTSWFYPACPTIVTIHDLILKSFPEYFFSNKLKLLKYKFLLWSIKKYTKIIITDSEFSKKDIVSELNLAENRVKVVPLGIEESFCQIYQDFAIVEVRKKFNITKKFIMFVGGLDFHKNVIGLINAFKKFIDAGKLDYQLVIVGAKGYGRVGNVAQEAKKLIKELNLERNVIFTDFVEDKDLVLLYNSADLFILPSLKEGFGLPPLEAMACGCPVIVSNSSALPEIVGDAAVLFNPYDTQDIANKIYKVLSDENLKNKLISKGLQRVKDFKWDKTASKMISIYEEVARSDN